jgi:hypothetical protein
MNDLLTTLRNDFTQAFNWRERRHEEWTENYTLYRDRIITNRLTQRQSVNVPLMKETIRTFLAGIDDAPELSFEDLGGDDQKDIYIQEYWEDFEKKNKLSLKDIVDKKQVALFGRSFKKLNVVDGKPRTEILDPQDILVDRYVDPTDIDSAAFVIHLHIYRTLGELEKNKNYDQEAVSRLKAYYATEMGLIKAAENYQSALDKSDKMSKMGVPDIDAPILGETYVELNEHYRKIWNEKKEDYEIHLIIKANEEILMDKPLEEIIGKTKNNYWRTHYPFSTWADDIECSDFWSDGLADVVRVPNKILNAWFSQLVENRTLRSFGMNYYDSSLEGFVPQTFQPVPWGWYPIPGKPNEAIQKIDIPELSDSLDDMTFIIQMVERATAVTAIQKGVSEKRQITLGEVQLLAGKAQERATAVSKFYRESWKDFGERWLKLIEAQADKLEPITVFKKSHKGKMFKKVITPSMWQSDLGYRVKVRSAAEQETETFDSIQKLQAAAGQLPNNKPLQEIKIRKILDLAGLTKDEIKEVMEFEERGAESPTSPGKELLAEAFKRPTMAPVA